MFELTVTKIKYPKNDTKIYEYKNIDNLLKDLKTFILNNKISKNDIIRIRGVEM